MMDSVLRMPGDHCMWCVEPSDVPCQLGCRKPRMPRDSFERWKMEATGVPKPHEMPDLSATPVSAADGEPLFRSPQGEDHEQGIEAMVAALHEVFRDYGPNLARLNPNDLEAVALRLSRVSPSRVGSVAVEDVEKRWQGEGSVLSMRRAVRRWTG
jgi:hypothetical protein